MGYSVLRVSGAAIKTSLFQYLFFAKFYVKKNNGKIWQKFLNRIWGWWNWNHVKTVKNSIVLFFFPFRESFLDLIFSQLIDASLSPEAMTFAFHASSLSRLEQDPSRLPLKDVMYNQLLNLTKNKILQCRFANKNIILISPAFLRWPLTIFLYPRLRHQNFKSLGDLETLSSVFLMASQRKYIASEV